MCSNCNTFRYKHRWHPDGIVGIPTRAKTWFFYHVILEFDSEETINNLRKYLESLHPVQHYETLKYLMKHLRKWVFAMTGGWFMVGWLNFLFLFQCAWAQHGQFNGRDQFVHHLGGLPISIENGWISNQRHWFLQSNCADFNRTLCRNFWIERAQFEKILFNWFRWQLINKKNKSQWIQLNSFRSFSFPTKSKHIETQLLICHLLLLSDRA